MSSSLRKRHIALVSTGGTIEKTYDEFSGLLENQVSVLDVMLGSLTLNGVTITRVPLMNKDSLEMTDADHDRIAETACSWSIQAEGVLVVHGTDRLAESGRRIHAQLGTPSTPIVLTGAIRPYLLRNTDALQNLTEALLAVQVLDPGVYVAMHNRVLPFPNVRKDRSIGTFVEFDPDGGAIDDASPEEQPS